jgi:murein DD-endopeptidase MepM/ murein hydrolase activator NlpD
MNPIMRKAAILLVLTGMLLSACGTNLWGTYDPYLTATPTSIVTVHANPEPTPTNLLIPLSTTQAATDLPSPTVTPTIAAVASGTPRPMVFYSSQSGDSLEAVALHFSVQVSEISSTVSLPSSGLLNPDTPLVIPNRLSQTPTTPSKQIIPDSELVFSPSAQSFDIKSYVSSLGGKLSTFREPRGNIVITGAEGVRLMAFGSSISPRMLLALIQYYTGWVQGQPKPGVDETYPLGYQDPLYKNLYQQLRLIVRELLAGYYGWRDGTLTGLAFLDGTALRLSPDLNAGTVALQYMFSRHLNYADWLQAIDPKTGFPALFTSMFGDPWERAQETGPLFPPDLTQPPFTLPFEVGVMWSLTSGPHPAWEQESALAALDFAPAMDKPGCGESPAWVVAIASGLIVRSADGYVVLDLDGDGFEQTGWVVLYQHVATKDRIPVGTWVNTGDHVGHPSCEGGMATGTHVHIARKYNGEWVSAGDPLPFILSGWTAHAGDQLRQGTLTKGNKTITASTVGSHESQIIRKPGE